MTSDINKINEQINDLEYKINKGRSEIKTARAPQWEGGVLTTGIQGIPSVCGLFTTELYT